MEVAHSDVVDIVSELICPNQFGSAMGETIHPDHVECSMSETHNPNKFHGRNDEPRFLFAIYVSDRGLPIWPFGCVAGELLSP